MTVVAYRDGILASDSLATMGYTRAGGVIKIASGPDGSLVGLSGNVGDLNLFMKWFQDGEKAATPRFKSDPSFTALVIRPNGDVFLGANGTDLFLIDAPFHAIGSGSEFAIGAMAMGASAVESVEVAIRFCTGCGGDVKSRKLEPIKKKQSAKRSPKGRVTTP